MLTTSSHLLPGEASHTEDGSNIKSTEYNKKQMVNDSLWIF